MLGARSPTSPSHGTGGAVKFVHRKRGAKPVADLFGDDLVQEETEVSTGSGETAKALVGSSGSSSVGASVAETGDVSEAESGME